MSYFSSIFNETSLDAFGRLRTSNPQTLFDSKLLYDDAPLFWDESLESGAGITSSHSTDTAAVTLTSTVSTAGVFTRQTFMRFNYQPGKSQLIFMTFVLDASGGGTGCERRVGIFDDNNGIFLEDDAGTYGITRRTYVTGSAVDNTVVQSSWNIDKMDGTGPSGVTIDFTKTQILVIDYEWLGVGRVRVGFNIDGATYYVHEFLNANNLSDVYMSTPNLPLRYQMVTTASSPASTMKCICSSVVSEGGLQDTGVLRYSSTNNTQVDCAVVGTLYLVKGIRLKSTHLSATIKVLSAAIQIQSTGDDLEWSLVFDPTYSAGPTWGNETNSSVQTCTGAGETVTNGYTITGGYIASGTGGSASASIEKDIENALLLGSTIAGTAQTIALCAKSLSNVNTLVEGSITWRELL